ncbi:acetyl-CoA C-acetyltransferase [Enterococcus haemoperoxidus ATCC BAA-382]|uniref:acetyl-CoA C-acetyltransferase n=1 Tax=Enterococcus haemoperoxidus ATCC BAA-382 TaxID=1158608 RepID=R2SU16_9ENTE|nr:hydroxymethylglutaryl-CoA reductase, degradative [Enterococcus haemoperoxidus]EOH98735.1 acetyl-CoA C-acetyltransferase [Enterococcus haemoperoxidus ATCC BAA-382]EOT62082.1 hydroxymethylglutaryl-CoA reductase, degradative [Enterococcus haemoperoxidus ATCC BAA-382]OJG55838.1 acetyl-CoA C-acetyltransferase [Enterococcus haemoperoxidus]
MEIVIIDALRTPIGKYRGQLKSLSAVELGTAVTKELLKRNTKAAEHIKQVVFGNVLQAGNGQNPARQIAINSGLGFEVPAFTVNEVCGSGMKAISLAKQAIQLGQAEVIIAGGTESMTTAPAITYKEEDTYSKPAPTMMVDGLTDAFSGKAMGLTAENVAQQFTITREMQDAFAAHSQRKAAQAQAEGKFVKEIVPLSIDNAIFEHDEGVRKDTTVEKLSTLKTVFKADGSVTAGNASTINDAASAMILASKSFAEEHQIPYLAIVKDVTEIGIDPSIMGISPIKAIQTLLQRNDLTVEDIDLFEINEAFAASSIVVQNELKIPDKKLNIWGGGISLGHPIGASGTRIVATLAHQLEDTNGQYGVASLCVGGGLGLAMLIERPQKAHSDKKFYQLSKEERLTFLQEMGNLSIESRYELENMSLDEDIANHLIENQISEMALPMGVVPDILVNNKSYQVPMATEEPSVIAACSNGAKMIQQSGSIHSKLAEGLLRGQIVFMNVNDSALIEDKINQFSEEIFVQAEKSYPSIVKRGGGLKRIQVRQFTKDNSYLSVDLLVDTKDAMGANILNSILEGVADLFRQWFDDEILFSILSNYATESLVTATCDVSFASLSKTGDLESGRFIAEKIAAASQLAQIDPYRATTHNKGIMNGIEAVILATGNDTRAVAAAAHAYASTGSYHGLSRWKLVNDGLKGTIELPLAIGTVGGAIRVLPKAQAALEILNVTDAKELAEVIAAIGLAQNLAALRALVSEGIQQGHMSLQARSLAMSVGAKGAEIEIIAERLKTGVMNQEKALAFLLELR